MNNNNIIRTILEVMNINTRKNNVCIFCIVSMITKNKHIIVILCSINFLTLKEINEKIENQNSKYIKSLIFFMTFTQLKFKYQLLLASMKK